MRRAACGGEPLRKSPHADFAGARIPCRADRRHIGRRANITRKEDSMNSANPRNFVLCFRSLFNTGRGYAFPCDAEGHVDLDRMSERARCNYFFARAMVGREVAVPEVEKPPHH
jgi:hypothetical protein